MVIGGILARSFDAYKLSQDISRVYEPYGWPESIQWKYISKAKLKAYKAVIDLIAESVEERRIDFGCIVFDQSKVDHEKYNENDPEKGFFKFLYQHHMKWHRHYRHAGTIRTFHGNMETKYDLNELRNCLNNSVKPHLRRMGPIYKTVDFLPVNRTRCMQIADLLIGAVGFASNGKYEAKPSSPQAEIYRHMMEAFCRPGWECETQFPEKGFHVWRFRL